MTRLEARGHHVEVLCSAEHLPGVVDPGTDHERNVHRELELYFRDGDVWSPPLRRRLAIERRNQRALADAIDSCQPEVVAVWHVGAMSFGLVTAVIERGLPIVYNVQDLWPAYVVKLDPWLRLFARWRPLGIAAQAVTGVPSTVPDLDASGGGCFISQHTRQRVRQGSRWQFPCSGVVFSGVERDVFRLPDDGRDQSWSGRLLYVGRLDPRKGVDSLLRALASLEDTTLSLVGRGSDPEMERLAALVAELGIADRVRFSVADRADLPAVYAGADVCVFPSEWEEPFGLVPLEAMSCGTPVIATGTGGSGEYLRDGRNCLLFTPGDVHSLVAAVRRVAADAGLRDTLTSGGLDTARFFDIEHVADDVEAWHDAAVAGFPDGPLPDRRPPD